MEDLWRNHAIASVSGVAISTLISHPLDTLKTLLQVYSEGGQGAGPKLNVPHIWTKVQEVAGFQGLYGGFRWAALGRLPALGARFCSYELLTAYYKDGRGSSYVYPGEAFISGFAAGGIEALINSPFELLKTRAQVSVYCGIPSFKPHHNSPNAQTVSSKLLPGYIPDKLEWGRTIELLSKLPSKHSNISLALERYPWMLTGSGKLPPAYEVKNPLQVISLEGWGAFWRGFRPGLFRDCIFSGVFFSCWQIIHTIMLDVKAVKMDPPPRSFEEISPVSPLAESLAAGCAGSVAGFVSHCFDTSKCRSQCLVIPKYLAMETKLLKWKPRGKWFERFAGFNPKDRQILFRGIGLRMAKCGMSCFTLVGGYYLAIDLLF